MADTQFRKARKEELKLEFHTWFDKALDTESAKKGIPKSKIEPSVQAPEIVVETPVPTGMQVDSMIQIPKEAAEEFKREYQSTTIDISSRDPTIVLEDIAKNQGYVHLRGFKRDNDQGKPSVVSFKIQKELGRGAFGVVLECYGDGIFTKALALKVLKPQPTFEQEYIARRLFRQEIAASRDLEDKSFAYLWGAGIIEETNTLGFASENVQGKTLEKVLKTMHDAGKRLHPLLAGLLFWRWLSGADSMHKQGFAHRDHKGANLMIRDQDGLIKILDMGGVKQIGTQGYGEHKMALGTPHYQHPSVALATYQSKVKYNAGDFHAICVEAYKMLAGKYPWDTDILKYYDEQGNLLPAPREADFNPFIYQLTKAALMAKTDLVPPHVINCHVPKILSDIIMEGLKENIDNIPPIGPLKDKLQRDYIHCSWWGGVGAQDGSVKKYLSLFDPKNKYDPNASVRDDVLLRPLALANLYDKAVALYTTERRTMMLQKGKADEVEKKDIETDSRLRHRIDYSLGSIDTTFMQCTGKLAARTLCPLYGMPLEPDFDENWDAYYEVLREEEFNNSDRLLEQEFWSKFRMHTPKVKK